MRERRLAVALLLLLLAGGGCDPFSSATPPAPAATRAEHGELSRMLADRPKLREELAHHPSLRRWIRDRFRERRTGLVWDPALPQSGQPAEHAPPAEDGGPIALRLSTEWTGRDQLGLVVYELVNMRNAESVDTLWTEAREGKRARKEFAVEMTRLEHGALVTFKELARKHRLVPTKEDRMLERILEAPDSFEAYREWLDALHAKDGGGYDPFVYWENAYDDYVGAAP